MSDAWLGYFIAGCAATLFCVFMAVITMGWWLPALSQRWFL